MPPTVTISPSLELVQRAVGFAAELVADRGQRMLRDIEPERLFFQLEQVILVELVAAGNRGMVPRRGVAGGLAEVEDRPLAEQLVGLLLLPPGERLLEHVEHPAPG